MDTFHNVGSEKREIPFWFAIIPLVAMIVAMIITIVVLEGDPHSPLILGTMIAAFIAWSSVIAGRSLKRVCTTEFAWHCQLWSSS